MTTDTHEPVSLLLRRYAISRDPKLRDEIIERHAGLVRSVAQKFARPGVPVEDLMQAAWFALIGAFDRFDPTRGAQFTTYAVTCMVGEIKRHFRDRAWGLKVPRELQDIALRIPGTKDALAARLGHSPTVSELANAMHVSEELVSEAMEAHRAYQPANLDAVRSGRNGLEVQTLAESVGSCDAAVEGITERDAIASAIATLDERHQRNPPTFLR
jgi:RNA polymerase sigma-B factor